MFAKETSILRDIRSPEELREVYSLGLILYYQHDAEQAARVRHILTETFPHHLVYVTPGLYNDWWPADSGMQLNGKLYTNGSSRLLIQHALLELTNMDKGQLDKVMPIWAGPHIEGGNVVPVFGTNTLAYCGDFRPVEDPEEVFKEEQMHAIRLESYKTALYRLHRGFPPTSIRNGWIFGNTRKQHIDLLLTGFFQDNSIVWYLDDALDDYTHRAMFVFDSFVSVARRFPHRFALRGGLNIQYAWNGYTKIALVPSRGALGPLESELDASGFSLVELGDDQVSARDVGAVKCRSLIVRWRDVDAV